MKWGRFRDFMLAVVLFLACCALAPSAARSEDCPAPNRLERLGETETAQFWMTLCIPPGNDLYRVEHGRLEDLFWRGDLQVPQPAGYDPAQLGADPDLTVATAWHTDHSHSGAIFDPIVSSILKAAQSKSGNGTFDADIPFNGHVFPVSFESLDGGLLKGTYSAIELSTGQVRTMTFFLRPVGTSGRPHLAICGTKKELRGCTVFTNVADQEVLMLVAGYNLDRFFRLSEEIVGKLNAFAILRKSP